jgi:hypothetical protein
MQGKAVVADGDSERASICIRGSRGLAVCVAAHGAGTWESARPEVLLVHGYGVDGTSAGGRWGGVPGTVGGCGVRGTAGGGRCGQTLGGRLLCGWSVQLVAAGVGRLWSGWLAQVGDAGVGRCAGGWLLRGWHVQVGDAGVGRYAGGWLRRGWHVQVPTHVQHLLDLPEQLVGQVLVLRPAHHLRDLGQHPAHAVLQLHQLAQPLLQDRREVEQPQRVARRRGVEHDAAVVHRLHLLQHLREAHGLVDARDVPSEVLYEAPLGAVKLLQLADVRGGIDLLRLGWGWRQG